MKLKKGWLSLIVMCIIGIISAIAIMCSVNKTRNISKLDIETMRAMNYDQLTEEDEFVDNCSNNIKFSAFFAKDLNGDGKAEKVLGSCKEIGGADTLYIELNVLEEGYLKEGKIKINSNNFTYTMQMVKDTVLKNNYVSSNVKNIELNDVYAGTQKLIMGTTRAQIKDKDSYTAENTVTLEGIYVNNNGDEVPISKTINLTIDWYGTAEAKITTTSNSYNIDELYGEDGNKSPTVEFNFTMEEAKKQLLPYEQNIEVTIPDLYGYYPTEVSTNISSNLYSYNEETHILSIKNTTRADSTQYQVTVLYPDEAYNVLKEDDTDAGMVNLMAEISGYFVCHNNTNEEFDNPYTTSTVTKNASVVLSNNIDVKPSHGGSVKLVDKVFMTLPNKEYVISKQEILDAYNTEDESQNVQYIVNWTVGRVSLDTERTTLVVKDTYDGGDLFDNNYMEDYTSNVGIYFGNTGLIPNDGSIYIYNDETNELIKEFKNGEWQEINKQNIYYYDEPIKDIRIETTEDKLEINRFEVYNVREIDISKLKGDFTREDIEDISKITTTASFEGSKIENQFSISDYASFVTAKSYNRISISQTSIATSETEPVKERITINIPTSNPGCADWQNGVFLVEIPSKIIYAKLNDVTINKSNINIDGYELYKENGKYFIKIVTSNDEPASNFEITIDCDMLADPMSSTSSESIDVYSYNEYCDMYYNTATDIYDLDGDESLSDVTGIESATLLISAPSTFVTTQTISNYNDKDEITVAPNIAEVTKDTREATINIEFANNYTNSVSDVKILGKVPFEGNTYVSGTSLNSEYTVKMKNGGITVPSELQNITTIYYSEQENPNKELDDVSNGWKTAEEVTSFENIKTYLIVINSSNISRGKTYKFSYTVTIPDDVTANLVTYACHVAYFDLNTDGGTLATSVQPNKVGMRITRYYDMEVIKYKEETELGVQGAKYQLSWEDDENNTESRIVTSTSQGILRLDNLRANETYTFKEITAPHDYELNEEIIKFKVKENDNKELEIEMLEGSFGGNTTIDQDANGKDVLKSCVYDSPKVSINLTKIDSKTQEKLTGVIFEIDGKKYITKNGNTQIAGLSIGKTYTLKETYAPGYYLEEIEFTIQKNSDGNIYIESSNKAFQDATIKNTDETDLIQVDLTITNEKIPTYNLQIVKIDDNNEETKLANARFLLSRDDLDNHQYYTTDKDGIINISGLYQHVEGKNITGRYTLQESQAPSGYILNKEKISFVVTKNEEEKLEIAIENKENLNTLYDAIVEDEENIKLIIQNKPFFEATKIDEETGKPLANVEFIIYELDGEKGTILDYAKDVNGEYIGTQNANGDYVLITDSETGKITAPLRNGIYKMIEATYPEGYEEKQNAEVFEITGNKATKNELEVPTMEDNTTEVLEISCIEELVDFQIAVNSGENYADTTVKLTKTLDFNSDDSYKNPNDTSYGDYNGDGETKGIKAELTDTSGAGFTPIGTYELTGTTGSWTKIINCFEGIFDGQRNVIENIYINHDSDYTGLFGYSEGLRVKDLGITGVIYGKNYTGGLCGYAKECVYIENCYNSVTIYANEVEYANVNNKITIGGIVGYIDHSNVNIINCYNSGTIYANEVNYCVVGGIVGYNNSGDGTIINCYNTGDIICDGSIGGIVGCSSVNKIDIYNCYNTGNLSGSSIGGIVAEAFHTNIIDCYNAGKITTTLNYDGNETGGIAGQFSRSNMERCYNIGNIDCNDGEGNNTTGSSQKNIGGIIGETSGSDYCKDCYNEGNINVNTNSFQIYCGGIIGVDNRNDSFAIEQCYNVGNITISVTGDAYIGGIAGSCSRIEYCCNTGNIIVEGDESVNIGGITAMIKELLYCYNSGDLIRRNKSNGNTNTTSNIGGIVAATSGNVAFCYNTGNIENTISNGAMGTCRIGGISGYSSGSNIKLSYNTGNITNNINVTGSVYTYIAGIAGSGISTLEQTYNTGNIQNYVKTDNSTVTSYVAGIASESFANAKYNYNTGSIYNNITGYNTSASRIYTRATTGNNSLADQNYYLDNIDIVGENITTTDSTAVSDEYMRSEEFYNIFAKSGLQNAEYWKHINGQYPILDIAITANAPKVTKLTVKNTKKQFDITTEIAQNNSGNRDGGTITGTYNNKYIASNNKMYVETVKYGERNTKSIEIKPNDGYSIAEIEVNGTPIGFNAENDGKYILQSGSIELKENYHIVVTFEKQEELFTINKVNEKGDPLEGATFRIESDNLGENSYDLVNNNKHYFYESDGGYIPNNIGTKDTVANSYIEIDLRGLTGNYYVNLDANLYGPGIIYSAINQSTEAPDYNNESECFLYSHSNGSNTSYKSNLLEGGKLYNLHLGYFTDYAYTGTIAKFSNISVTSEDGNKITNFIIEKTDKNGQIKKALPMGTYKITEIEAPEGYMLDSNPTEYTMESNKVNKINILNRKLNNVIVHYYLDKTGEEYNKEPVVIQDDIELTGYLGTEYASSPYINIGKYTLITDENEEYVVPDNASGQFEDETINVYYYYEEPKLEGTYNLVVTKVNAENTNEKVAGAEFDIYEGDTKVGTLTDEDNDGVYESGYITVSEAGIKNITIKETVAPTGYARIADKTGTITFEKSEDGKELIIKESSFGTPTDGNIPFTIEEPTLKGTYSLVVTKVNAENTDEKVSGAEFEIYEEGTKVGTLTDTNNDGIYESGDITVSEAGTKNITIKETVVPTGYARIADRAGTITFEKSSEKDEYIVKESSFGIPTDGNIAFTIEEPTLKGTYSLEITKVDTEGNKVPGAEFTVYEGSTEIAKLTDDNNDGIYESGDIGISEQGTISITIEETIVPKGYVKADSITGTITFSLGENGDEYIVKESTLGNVSEEGLKISFEVIEEKQKDEKYDLAIKKFISAIDNKEITTRAPKAEVSENGTVTYSQNDKIEQVANGQLVTYTMRIYNESNVIGKGKRVIEYIPDGLVFLPEEQKNIDCNWEMYIVNQDGTWNKTDDPEKATIIVTDDLVNKEISARDGKNVSHLDVEATFKVDETKLTSKDRIIENTVEINRIDNDDNPGTEDNEDPDNNPENDKTTEKLYVKYFDLSIKKYIKQVVMTDDIKSETIEVPKESQKDVKVNVNKSKINKTTLTVTYALEIKNVGEIEGNADKIAEYIPDEFKLEDSESIWLIDGKVATTESLSELVIKPGETKTIEVLFTWKLSENTSGVRSNKAKIEEYSNPHDAIDLTDDNEDSSDIEVIIINDKYDLAIKKFISAIDNEKITTRIPKVEISQDGKITYMQNNNTEQVANSQEVTYTLRMYNESDIKGKGKIVIEYIPDGLVFLPENETNQKYNWVMFKEDENGQLVRTENTEEAVIVATNYLVDKEINAFNKDTDSDLSYLDVEVVFKVDETKLTSEDRIIENKVQIMPNDNDDYPNNDESIEKLYVKYFDLDITKYIEEVKVKNNKGEATRQVGEDQKGELVKIDIKKSDVKDTTITVTYGLVVRNVGEISGYATQIIDYVPQDFELVEDGIWSIDGNKAITTSLENILLEPGESTKIHITFEWKLNKGNIGSRTNEAKIANYTNQYNAIDLTEDNNDKEEMLVTVKTGSEIIMYIIIGLGMIIIIGTGTAIIKKRFVNIK